jgi:hypothetical protein
MWLEEKPQAYTLPVSGKEFVWLKWREQQVRTVMAALPDDGWIRHF